MTPGGLFISFIIAQRAVEYKRELADFCQTVYQASAGLLDNLLRLDALLADKGRRKEVFDLLGTRCGDNILDG